MADATRGAQLTLGEWAVLGLLAGGPLHAFALVKATARGGQVGRVWSVPTPVVYRAVNRLRALTLVVAVGEEPSDAGPPRTVLSITPSGRAALQDWLTTPVEHVRDVRSQLLLKLAILTYLNQDVHPLVGAQLDKLAPVVDALERRAASSAQGFDHMLARWRFESARSVRRFLEAINE